MHIIEGEWRGGTKGGKSPPDDDTRKKSIMGQLLIVLARVSHVMERRRISAYGYSRLDCTGCSGCNFSSGNDTWR